MSRRTDRWRERDAERRCQHAAAVASSERLRRRQAEQARDDALDRADHLDRELRSINAQLFATVGVFTAAELTRLLPEETAARLRGTAERVELHVDTRDEHDVLIVADAKGSNPTAVEDLAKSLGAALAVSRVTARHDGDEALAQLLDLARISPETGAFRVEVGLPLELLRRRFGRCAEDAGTR